MRRDLAEQLMAHLHAIEAPTNALSTLSEQLEGEERTRVRRSIGQIMATAAVVQLEITKQYPDLDPDQPS
jgi:hypothetical protein